MIGFVAQERLNCYNFVNEYYQELNYPICIYNSNV